MLEKVEYEGEGEGNNNIGQGELGGGVGFEGTVAIQDRARVFYRNNTTQEYIEFNNSVNINNFNNTTNLNDCVFNGYSVSLSKNNNILGFGSPKYATYNGLVSLGSGKL